MTLPWLPWLLTACALGIFLLAPASNGLVLVLVWSLVVAAYRAAAGLLRYRVGRLWVDALFALGCLLAAFEGGWYLLPAVAAFARQDWGHSAD